MKNTEERYDIPADPSKGWVSMKKVKEIADFIGAPFLESQKPKVKLLTAEEAATRIRKRYGKLLSVLAY